MIKKIRNVVLGSTLVIMSSAAFAAPITYIGADDAVSSIAQMVNSNAAAADFLNVTGNIGVYDFESAIPANLTITGGTTVNTNCGSLCGFNTTAGGSFWREVVGGSVTFTFVNPVDAFGFFVNGLQTDLVPQQTIEYVDGSLSQQIINMPSSTGGGGAFIGFIDFGQLISSVTFNATSDILGFDDLRFGRSQNDPGDPNGIPAPATLLLFVAGLLGLRLRSRK
ncbi:PEP-CTERM sorting domain-containing protein [Aliiglaciecola litoralis]|uniref:PEP-CTERM protein-sorting domain-containing protein n=1 Tax=Aliiglaciecola litoralis TaxID=582857 RepID=A0ABP3WS83_9ALTE